MYCSLGVEGELHQDVYNNSDRGSMEFTKWNRTHKRGKGIYVLGNSTWKSQDDSSADWERKQILGEGKWKESWVSLGSIENIENYITRKWSGCLKVEIG